MKAHIAGPPGSGKTTLAREIARICNVPAYDLDWIVYDDAGERPRAELLARIDEIRDRDGWVTDGAYAEEWVATLLADAETIVWLDVPWRVCALRMVKRHVRAELARNNRHPGWRKLYRFLRYTRSTATSHRARTRAMLAPYASKVVRCASAHDVASFVAGLRE